MKRCAVYTRKSSDEGLEQGFNSLDAQREACEAYVLSQAGEDWSASSEAYDDGGYSGGSMERPGLQALLRDVRAGSVDVIVVYKIDRLTRSLADFARIVEIFDAAGVSFVSVTQAFNTTSSMGRLTLNVLLSFAQFEREVTGERIRDKIAASKAKGMWMGGLAPLGYDLPTDGTRTLSINEQEAETVRHLFRRYLELGSVYALIDELDRDGIRSKKRVTANGRELGGQPFSRGAMFHLLRNRVYVGEIVHKDQVYPGQHVGIVDRKLFDAVQAKMATHRRERTTERTDVSPLAGKLIDRFGRPMSPTHSRSARGKRYRYYLAPAAGERPAVRISAIALESFVTGVLRVLLPDEPDPSNHLQRIQLLEDEVILRIPARLRSRIRSRLDDEQHILPSAEQGFDDLHLPTRIGAKYKRIRPATHRLTARRDQTLIRALRSAHAMVELGRFGVPEIKAVPGPRYDRRLIRLAFLAPDIQRSILAGTQPVGLCLEDLIRSQFPVDWTEQRAWITSLAG